MVRLVSLLIILSALLPSRADAQPACTFQLGFKAIADQIPDVVGRCLEDEWHNPGNGNTEQRTTAHHGKGGLLVWRKADNWTAFTDGHWTWVNGPNGLQRRLNTERFDWEAPPDAAMAPGPPPAAAAASRRGGALELPLFGVYVAGHDPAAAERAAAVGARLATVQVVWSDLQPSAGAPLDPAALGRIDALVAGLAAKGITPVGIVGGAPGWAAVNPHGPLRPGREDAYLAFLERVVRRYGEKPYGVRHWLLWPEPDAVRHPARWTDRGAWGEDPAAFAALMRAVRTRLSAAAPEARIVLGPLAHDWFLDPGPNHPSCGGASPGFNCGGIFRYAFLDEVLRHGIAGSFDALALNAYPVFSPPWEADAARRGAPAADVAAKIAHVRARLQAHGVDVPILLGEAGYWSAGVALPVTDGRGNALGETAASPQSQADYVAKLYARAMHARAAGAVWFALDEVDPATEYGLYDDGGRPKPAAAAFRRASQAFGRAEPVPGTWLSATEGTVEAYRFARPDRDVVVAWAVGPAPARARVAAPAGARASGRDGAPLPPLERTGDRAAFALTESPAFFERSA